MRETWKTHKYLYLFGSRWVEKPSSAIKVNELNLKMFKYLKSLSITHHRKDLSTQELTIFTRYYNFAITQHRAAQTGLKLHEVPRIFHTTLFE